MSRSSTTKRAPTNVTVPRNWQIAFIAVMALAQLVSVYSLVWGLWHIHQYGDSDGWTYQIVQFMYPILFVIAGYLFVLRRVSGRLPRLFWAVFIGTIGMALNSAVQIPLLYLNQRMNIFTGSDHRAWWQGFGWLWIEMGAFFVLYCAALWFIARKGNRT